METLPLSEIVLITMALLAIAMIAAGLFRNLSIPFTVLLVIIGMGLGELATIWEPLAPLHEFRLTPELVFFIFLPALIFESGFNLDARQLVKDLGPILAMAIPALLISTTLIGLGLWLITGLDIMIALVFGALISATDPVAVIALFKELGAPLRLTVLVEGESLLNDATAIVVFTILLGLAMEGGGLTAGGAGLAVLDFLRVFLGGALVGIAAGFLVSELVHRLESDIGAILAMSIVLAYASFIVAEHLLHVSGVMAAVGSAVVLGMYGVTRIPQEGGKALAETWELIALISNSLLFLLVGLSLDLATLASHAGLILVVVLLVLAARALTVYTLVPASVRLFSLPHVSLGERHIMWWGGLKGGLAIAIVLSIPDELPGKELLLFLTLGVVLFTLLVNAWTIRPLMRYIGMDRFTPDEQSELRQGLERARASARAILDRFLDADITSRDSHAELTGTLDQTLAADTAEPSEAQQERQVYLTALRTEYEELTRLHTAGVISQYTLMDLRNTLQRDRDSHGTGSAPVQGQYADSPFQRMEKALLGRLREQNWAAPLLSRYQRLRLSQRLQRDIAGVLMCQAVLDRLGNDSTLHRGACEAVMETYRKRLDRRRARIDAVRLQFPEFYRSFEIRLGTRAMLRSAANRTDRGFHHGELGAKVVADIRRRIDTALGAVPPLAEPASRPDAQDLIQRVPLFAGLSERALEGLAGHAHAVTFLPGDIVIQEGDHGDALYIISQGEADVYKRDESGAEVAIGRMGVGEFFGEMALLGDSVRTATVRAASPATLLRLTRKDILTLSRNHPEVGERLEETRLDRTDTGVDAGPDSA